jgi:hypothetical protein
MDIGYNTGVNSIVVRVEDVSDDIKKSVEGVHDKLFLRTDEINIGINKLFECIQLHFNQINFVRAKLDNMDLLDVIGKHIGILKDELNG